MICKYCEKPKGSITWLRHHWGFSCPKLDKSAKEHYIRKYKLIRRDRKRNERKIKRDNERRDLEILMAKLPDRSNEVLDNIEVLKRALTEKTMNPEKIMVLANWIKSLQGEKLEPVKEECDSGNHNQYFDKTTQVQGEYYEDANIKRYETTDIEKDCEGRKVKHEWLTLYNNETIADKTLDDDCNMIDSTNERGYKRQGVENEGLLFKIAKIDDMEDNEPKHYISLVQEKNMRQKSLYLK